MASEHHITDVFWPLWPKTYLSTCDKKKKIQNRCIAEALAPSDLLEFLTLVNSLTTKKIVKKKGKMFETSLWQCGIFFLKIQNLPKRQKCLQNYYYYFLKNIIKHFNISSKQQMKKMKNGTGSIRDICRGSAYMKQLWVFLFFFPAKI